MDARSLPLGLFKGGDEDWFFQGPIPNMKIAFIDENGSFSPEFSEGSSIDISLFLNSDGTAYKGAIASYSDSSVFPENGSPNDQKSHSRILKHKPDNWHQVTINSVGM
ncbi:MAG: hypothetical protein Q7R51_01265 [bacterium]|nr:hypothetical protein [bacterium]